MTDRARLIVGETLRWYLTRARHPLKDYLVGHYWGWFKRWGVWVRYDRGGVLHVRLGDYVQQRIFFDGYYERRLVEWLHEMVGPEDVFWDVGANVGALTVVAARCGAQVVAFEPDDRSRRWLERNVAANRLENVTVVAGALGDRTGTATLHPADDGNTGRTSLVTAPSSAPSVEVPITSGDDFIAQYPSLSPTVMKIDVEGAEHLVLMGARAILQDRHLHTVIFEDRPGAGAMPTNAQAVQQLHDAAFRIEQFGRSDEYAGDGQLNFIARRATRAERS
jgi:FkbM family methyltransferase